jgi:hypothetical protein
VSVLAAVCIVLAGVGAGTINTIVGSGTLITFPTLLLFGVPPVAANMSNTVGLLFGGATGAAGYRSELVGATRTLRRLVPMSLLGGAVGATLLLVLDPAAFRAIVPVLIALGVLLVVLGPRLSAVAARHHAEAEVGWHGWAMMAGVFAAGIYGGYFGAAQGVLLMGIMTTLSAEPLQRLNGYKNVLATAANFIAAVVFVVVARADIYWLVAALIAVGSVAGGLLGATIGRRLSPSLLRVVIVVIGVVAIVKIVWFD